MKIRFIEDGRPHGYSFSKNEVHDFPEEIAELIILSGIAVRDHPQKAINIQAQDALKKARERDTSNR